jgi:uncharacterized protein DUF6502
MKSPLRMMRIRLRRAPRVPARGGFVASYPCRCGARASAAPHCDFASDRDGRRRFPGEGAWYEVFNSDYYIIVLARGAHRARKVWEYRPMNVQSEAAGRDALYSAVLRLLRPLVRILLNRGVPFNMFAEIARWAYVDVASREFGIPGRKQTDSRVSVLTGLTRKDVARIKGLERPEDQLSGLQYNRAARVVSAWMREYPLEGTASGAAPLALEGRRSFSELVRRHSGDMPVRAVIDELERIGAIRFRNGDEVELLTRHYIPQQGQKRKLVYLGDDVADLIATIGHNLDAKPADAHFQRKVFYDNVPSQELGELRSLARQRGEALIDGLVREMAAHDRDANPKLDGTGRHRAVVGVYYYEEPFGEQDDSDGGPPKRGRRRAK